MRKFVVVMFAALVCALVFCNTVAFAESDSTATAQPLSAQEFVQQLCKLNKAVASANSGGVGDSKKAVRTFISEQLAASLGNDSVTEIYFGEGDTAGYNIEGKLDVANTDQCVIVGAHYDARGEGAADNAVGVAVLMQVAKQLAENESSLPFDVYFVAFDCEEDGLVGSSAYVTSIGSADHKFKLSDVLVMFNVDTVAVGDMYLLCENKHTDLADLILSKCDSLSEKPYGKGVYANLDSYGYGYYENIQGTDHTPFRLQGIPTALLFAGNYGLLGYEYDSKLNSSDDTFDNLVAANPDYAQRISDAAGAIAGTVLDEKFSDVALHARKQLVNNDAVYNAWWPSLVVLGVLVILGVFTWLYHRKLQKSAILGSGEIKKNTVFDKPNAEDIFSFDGSSSNMSKDKPDADDIFTFKK